MRRLGRVLASAAALAIPFTTAAQACSPGGRTVLLMLDASYSMLRTVSRIASPTRFNVAREVLASVVDHFPPDGWMALRLYGSQTSSFRQDCQDTLLAVPFAPAAVSGPAIKLALAQSHARGLTPMALALERATRDFDGIPGDRRIVVVTDGGETCGGNPCATALVMGAEGVVIDAIGFQLNNAIARRQLECITKVTNGIYADARSQLELEDRLTDLLTECPVATVPRKDTDATLVG